MALQVQHCRSCGADVYWLKNTKTGKSAPIDAQPSDKGNIAVHFDDGEYQVIPAAAREPYMGMLRTSHFKTCPQAGTWRRHGGSGMRGKAQ